MLFKPCKFPLGFRLLHFFLICRGLSFFNFLCRCRVRNAQLLCFRLQALKGLTVVLHIVFNNRYCAVVFENFLIQARNIKPLPLNIRGKAGEIRRVFFRAAVKAAQLLVNFAVGKLRGGNFAFLRAQDFL